MQEFHYHNHTYRCGHADQIEDEEYIKEYLKNGFKKVAFTEHCPEKDIIDKRENIRMSYDARDDYLASIKRLKEKYKNEIIIESGYEIEYLPGEEKNLFELKDEVDKIVLGQHFIYDDKGNLKILGSNTEYSEDDLKKYIEYIKEALKLGLPDIIVHPDIYMFGQKTFGNLEEKTAHQLCQIAELYNIPLEINLAKICNSTYYKGKKFNNDPIAIQRVRAKKAVYPCQEFWSIASEYNIEVLYGLDVHHLGQISLFPNLITIANEMIGEDTIKKLKFISNESQF